MSSESTSATKRSTPSAFSRNRAKTASRHLTSEVIAADIAAFKKRGGSIEVLGNTCHRYGVAATALRSSEASKTKAAASEGAARG